MHPVTEAALLDELEKIAGVRVGKLERARKVLLSIPGARPGGNKQRHDYLWSRLQAKKLGRASSASSAEGVTARTTSRERLLTVPTIAKDAPMPAPWLAREIRARRVNAT